METKELVHLLNKIDNLDTKIKFIEVKLGEIEEQYEQIFKALNVLIPLKKEDKNK